MAKNSVAAQPPVATMLAQEYPELWALSEQYDFAERLGGCTSALAAEADSALREIWMARSSLRGQE